MRRGKLKSRLDVAYNNPENLGYLSHLYESVLLKNVVTSFSGGTPSKSKPQFWNGDVPWASPKDFIDFYMYDTQDHISQEGLEAARLKLAPKGTVLVVVRSGILKHTLPIAVTENEMVVNQDIKALLPSESINPYYLGFYLTVFGNGLLPIISKHSTTVQSINSEQFDALPIPIPPLDVQDSLAAEMRQARAQREQKLKQADELLVGLDAYLLAQLGISKTQAASRRAFGVRLKQLRGKRIDSLAYSLEGSKQDKARLATKSLQDIAHINVNKAAKPKDSSEGVPYVGLPECSLTQVREVTIRLYSEVKGRQVIRQGDILFARIEPSVFNQKYVLVDDLKGFDYAYTSTEFYIVRAKEGIVEQDFLYEMFFCSFVFEQVKGKTTGSSGRRRISLGLFTKLQIPVPNIELQKSIIYETRQRRNEARALQASAAQDWDAAKARFEQQLLGDT